MAHAYRAVGWNRQKRLYDLALAGGLAVYLVSFVGAGLALHPRLTAETLLLRAFGTAALLLLHLVLSIGPLCRLSPRFLPLLYNRRHLGVTTFLVALAHGALALVQFHSQGTLHPLVSALTSDGGWRDPAPGGLAWGDLLGGAAAHPLPFQPLGLAALGVLFLMAATSHDFWLVQLTPPVWKALHMAVYVAYALVVLHVALGALQGERQPLLTAALSLGLTWVLALHLGAGWRERRADRELPPGDPGTNLPAQGWVAACPLASIPEGRARVACIAGERVAVFRWEGKVAAVSAVCQHQNGPLGEGRILDGCITCPWHGFQYQPETGASPAPFTERVPTFRVRVLAGTVWVDPRPNPPGTRVEPVRLDEPAAPAAGGQA